MKNYPVIKAGIINGSAYKVGDTVNLSAIDAQTYFAQRKIDKSEKLKPAVDKAANKK